MSRPGSLKSFQKEKRDGDVTSGAACFKEATTEAKAAPRAPLSGVVGNHEKKKEAKAGADTKGDSPQKASCRSNKTRSGPTKVKRKDLPPPLPSSDSLTVSHTSPSLSLRLVLFLSALLPLHSANHVLVRRLHLAPLHRLSSSLEKRVVLHPMQLAKDRVLLRKRQTRFANIQRI